MTIDGTFTPPSNDDLANALAVTSGTAVTGTSLGATVEPSESQPTCGTGQTNSVWWAYTAPTAGTTTFSTAGSNFDTVVSIWVQTGTTGAVHPLTQVLPTTASCNDDGGTGITPQSLASITTTAGTTYYVRVAGYSQNSGAVSLTVTGPTPASFTSAAMTTQNTGTVFGDNTSFYFASTNNVVIGGNTGTTPATSFTFNLSGSTDASDILEARLYYTGSSTTQPTLASPQFGTPVLNPGGSVTFTGSQALPPGNNYFWLLLRIGTGATLADVVSNTFTSATVDGIVRTPSPTTLGNALTVGMRPINDNLAAAIQITATGAGTGVMGTNVNATREGTAEALGTCGTGGAGGSLSSVWWKYTPSTTTTATFSTAGSNFDTVLSIWVQTGATGAVHPLTQAPPTGTSCNDDGTGVAPQSLISNLAVTAGTTYYIRVSNYTAATGAITLTVTGPAPLVTVSQTLANGRGYRLLSAPVQNVTVGTLAGINLIQGVTGQYPGGTNPVQTNIFLSYAGTGGYQGSGYVAATNVTDAITPGAGFFWQLYDLAYTPPSDASNGMGTSQSYVLATRPLTATGTVLNANTSVVFTPNVTNGFYMGGNPFATAMTSDGVTASVGTIQTTMQLYGPNGMGVFGYTPVETTAATPLSTWQGFFIEQSVIGDPLTITYLASKRIAGNGTIVGRPATDNTLALALAGTTSDGTSIGDEAALIRAMADAATGWDVNDATKLVPPSSVYALIAPVGERGGSAYRQAVLSLPSATGDVTLAFTATHAGTYTISAEATGLPETATLRDVITGDVVSLANGYTFTSDATDWTDRFVVHLSGRTTAGEGQTVTEFALAAPAPNPTATATAITFDVPAASDVDVSVYDLLGRRVATLAQGQTAAGRHTVRLDAGSLAPGVYVVRMSAGTFSAIRRVTVVR